MHFTYLVCTAETQMKATELSFDQLGLNNSINYRFVLLADSGTWMLKQFSRS